MSVVLAVVTAVVVVYPVWRIAQKAGYPGWIALLILVPLANLGLLYFLALADWPALRRGTPQEPEYLPPRGPAQG